MRPFIWLVIDACPDLGYSMKILNWFFYKLGYIYMELVNWIF